MNSLRHFALGEPLSQSPHSIAGSLPTLEDVCGYEEKDPRVLSAMKVGYPRFTLHPYVRRLTDFFLKSEGLTDRFGLLVANQNAATDLLRHVGSEASFVEVDAGLQLIYCNADNSSLVQKISKYRQHVGCGVSSRQAEALLVKLGPFSESYTEELYLENGQAEVTKKLATLYGCDQEDLWVCASGMNAFYTGFRAVQKVQRDLKRNRWLQLGWLYLDSGCVLRTFLEEDETLESHYNIMDTDAVIDHLNSLGSQLAGVVVECPTNPLVQVCDLAKISAAVHKNGGLLIVDPTVASIYNMDVLPYADVLVTSLTKYAAHEGDIMIGSLALNIKSEHYGALKSNLAEFHIQPYSGDLQRLAYEMQSAEQVVSQMNANALKLVEFLQSHPSVSAVHFAAASPYHEQYARSPSNGGSMISIELVNSITAFYDKIAVMKGPSFGTQTTLLSPFMYLAHYDLVTQEKGRAFLKEVGISPELIRISVGIEPYDAIEAAFAKALDT